jgi:hypothetical protein
MSVATPLHDHTHTHTQVQAHTHIHTMQVEQLSIGIKDTTKGVFAVWDELLHLPGRGVYLVCVIVCQKLLFVCVCVRVCAFVCACVCVRACMCAIVLWCPS